MDTARVWKFGDDVDTDQILPSQYLILPDIAAMKQHAFETVYPDFSREVRPGDVVVGGRNFGCGSSREQAPAVLKALGVRAVVAKSFARIFFRNAINIGLPVVVSDALHDAVDNGGKIEIDLETGRLSAGDSDFTCTRLPAHMQEILDNGGLVESLKVPKPPEQKETFNPASFCSPMTMAEKIIARAAGQPRVAPGEIHVIALDGMMSNDGTTHLTIDMFHNLPEPTLADPKKMVFIVDHNSPADTVKTAAAHAKMRDFAKQHDIRFYEGKGVCHQLMVENHVTSGEFIIGADSHTCTYGALGAFGTGVGCTDFLYGMVTGTTWVMVPETISVELTGKLPPGVSPRDLMLTIIGDIGADGATYKVLEFGGDGLRGMSLNDRLVLANLAVEAGAKTALMEPDDKVTEYLAERGREPAMLCRSDENAVFAEKRRYNLDDITSVVARPHKIDDVVAVSEVGDVPVNQAFLGSCNAGRIDELRAAAALLRGRTISPNMRFIVSPASNEVYLQALKEGIVQTLNEAGATIVNPNCSVCWGSCQGVIGPGEVLISTGTRNFKGRSGSPESFVYLGSAETVTASAIAGHITTADKL